MAAGDFTAYSVIPKPTKFGKNFEDMYKGWIIQNNIPESQDYDMRGFYYGLLTGDPAATTEINPSDNQLHFTDKWKLSNHPTFSSESMYSHSPNDGKWVPAIPYKEGSWALQNNKGYKTIEIPQ